MAAPSRWWPNWKDPLIWLLGIAFGATNTAYFGANAFLPDYLVALGRSDLTGAALGWLNGAQLFASFGLLWLAGRVHRRAWPYLVYVQNWVPGRGTGDPLLSHLWSLAVEEQFYLVWPALVYLVVSVVVMAVSSAVVPLSSAAVGASLTEVTVIETVAVAVAPSLSAMV